MASVCGDLSVKLEMFLLSDWLIGWFEFLTDVLLAFVQICSTQLCVSVKGAWFSPFCDCMNCEVCCSLRSGHTAWLLRFSNLPLLCSCFEPNNIIIPIQCCNKFKKLLSETICSLLGSFLDCGCKVLPWVFRNYYVQTTFYLTPVFLFFKKNPPGVASSVIFLQSEIQKHIWIVYFICMTILLKNIDLVPVNLYL